MKRSITTMALLFAFMANVMLAQPQLNIKSLDEKLPLDPKVKVGKLDNGMKYYIRVNKKPEKRAELRLVVNAGAILEDDDQDGLAHFLEHMLFNGTKKFPKDELVSYLQSTGMEFGADINASTAQDRTLFKLQLPTDDKEKFEKGLEVLVEWAHNATLTEKDIDDERGVILEEWRTRTDARKRISDQLDKVLYYGSKYIDRDVVGDTSIIKHFPYEPIRRFYKDWYRPNLMSVIAVGDFDPVYIEKMIKMQFGKLKNPKNQKERKFFEIPNHKEMLVAVATDKEFPANVIRVVKKRDPIKSETIGDYKASLERQLYDAMLNARLAELRQDPKSPFVQASTGEFPLRSLKRIYMVLGVSKNNMIAQTLESILIESRRVLLHGFTPSELDRKKTEFLSFYENAYKEKDKTPSRQYLNEYMSNFLDGSPMPGIEYEYALAKILLKNITVADVNKLAKEYWSDGNRVIMVGAPDRPGIETPTKEDLIAIYNKVKNMDVAPYNDEVADQPFFNEKVVPGKITAAKKFDKIDVTELTLSNGAKVILKKTDFNNEQILFRAFSPGGTSVVPDNNYLNALLASGIINQSGLGDYDLNQLRKQLSGKLVGINPYIGSLTEGFNGSSTPADLETMMQMVHMYFTSPRQDKKAYEALLERIKLNVKNSALNPKSVFSDSIDVTMSQHHFRSRPFTEDMINEVDFNNAVKIYNERFEDAGDFTFFFIGAFDEKALLPMIEKYIASLPGKNSNEKWVDRNQNYPEGKINKKIHNGIMEKSTVRLIYTGDYDWNRKNNHLVHSLSDALNLKLRKVVREEKGGTYGAYSFVNLDHYPSGEYRIDINFDCAMERVDELAQDALNQVADLRKNLITEDDLHKVKEAQRRKFEKNLKENNFWLSSLFSAYYNNTKPEDILIYPDYVEQLTVQDIKDAANKYFNDNNFVRIVLYPAEK